MSNKTNQSTFLLNHWQPFDILPEQELVQLKQFLETEKPRVKRGNF